MTLKNREIWNFQILSDRPDRPIPAIWIGQIVRKSILVHFRDRGTHMLGLGWCSPTFMDHRPFSDIFETSKNHVLAETSKNHVLAKISAMVKISVKFYEEKNLYTSFISPVNISWIGLKLMKIFKNGIGIFSFQPHCRAFNPQNVNIFGEKSTINQQNIQFQRESKKVWAYR